MTIVRKKLIMEKEFLKVQINKRDVLLLKKHILKYGISETSGSFFGNIKNNNFNITHIYYSNVKGSSVFVYTPYTKKMVRFAKKFYKETNYNYEYYNYIGDWHTHPSFRCYPSPNDIVESRKDIIKLELDFVISTIMKVEQDNLIIRSYFITNEEVNEIPVIVID